VEKPDLKHVFYSEVKYIKNVNNLWEPVPTSLDGCENDGELEQAAGPDSEYDVLQWAVGGDGRLVEEIEELHDVEWDGEVDEEELWELISTDDALGQHPATNDEYQQCQLLHRVDQRLPV